MENKLNTICLSVHDIENGESDSSLPIEKIEFNELWSYYKVIVNDNYRKQECKRLGVSDLTSLKEIRNLQRQEQCKQLNISENSTWVDISRAKNEIENKQLGWLNEWLSIDIKLMLSEN